MSVENILNLKPVKFYSRQLNKLPDKWQELVGWLVGWVFGFYGISTFVGYLMPNPFLQK